MASRTQETLYESFKALATGGGLVSALDRTASQISQLTSITQSHTQSTGNAVLSAVSKVFTSGLGLVPLISGLFGLFGGGGEQPPPLLKFTMPERIYFQAAETTAGVRLSDYDQMGMPRAYGLMQPAPSTAGPTPASSAGPQITVNVQAMDARSFLDRSNEIALAVRQAMLNLNSINDVVSDL
jgi:hypothetical protein